jgi:hypothetical protein
MSYDTVVPNVRYPQASIIVPGETGGMGINTAASTAAGTANQAYYQPFRVSYTASLVSMSFSCVTGTNNHDLGIYRDTTRLASRGPTASTAGVVNTWTLTNPLVIEEGVLYYAAFATAGTKTICRFPGTSLINPRLGRMIETGLTAATLPATATFAPPAANALIPVLRLTFAY